MNYGNSAKKKKKTNKFLIVCLIILSLVVISSAIFFFTKNSSKNQKSSNQNQSDEKKFMLMVVYNNPNFHHPYQGECLFTHWNTNTGFRISLDHPALKGVELKEKKIYLVEGIKISSLHFAASKNKIGMSDKITITLANF